MSLWFLLTAFICFIFKNLAAEKTYNNLDVTVSQALAHRAEVCIYVEKHKGALKRKYDGLKNVTKMYVNCGLWNGHCSIYKVEINKLIILKLAIKKMCDKMHQSLKKIKKEPRCLWV